MSNRRYLEMHQPNTPFGRRRWRRSNSLPSPVRTQRQQLERLRPQVTQGRDSPEISNAEVAAEAIVLEETAASILQMDIRRTRGLIRVRRDLLGKDLASGTGWHILLRLFESFMLQRRDTLKQLCVDGEIARQTAVRWVRRLEERGLVELSDHSRELRNHCIELSASGSQKMMIYFAGVAPFLIAA